MTTAVITASYRNDFERCALLCESIDARLKGDWCHYLLVDEIDVPIFTSLAGDKRKIVSEREIFPWWFRSFPDPLSRKHARIWLSPSSWPVRGWHAQQLRRLAIAQKITEDVMLSIDSDVVMVRDFDVAGLTANGKTVLYSGTQALRDDMHEHLLWSKNAGQLLGLSGQPARDDYINTFIAWRTQSVRNLLKHIENVHQTHWLKQILKNRAMSECMIYGRYVQEIENGRHHHKTSAPLCHVLWDEKTVTADKAGLIEFLHRIKPDQVSVGIQSFVNVNLNDIRDLVRTFQT